MSAFLSRHAVHGLLLLSGFAGLGYQVVWIRLLAAGLGHEAVAMLGVVAAFFVGLALGAWLFDRAIARSRTPGRWYAALEIVIGLWALALIWLLPAANAGLAGLIGLEPSAAWRWLCAFAGPLLLLAPATVAMGATLPAAERLHARRAGDARGVAGLYAANAAGAGLGAAATLGLLGPGLGFNGVLAVFAGLNILCAALTLAGPARGERGVAAEPSQPAAAGDPPPARLLFATGLLGLGLEVAVARALAQTLENTVYSFAAVVALYLLGATLGGAAWQAAPARRRDWRRATPPMLGALALCSVAAALVARHATAIYVALRENLGDGFGALMAETLTTALAFLPAAAVMGALFAALAEGARRRDGGLGAALGINTLGAACAPLLVGVGLGPVLGAIGAMGAIAAGYAALAVAMLDLAPRHRAALAAGAAAAVVLTLAPLDNRLVVRQPGEAIHSHDEGTAVAATVLQAADGTRRLVVDGRFVMGGDATDAFDRLQGHLPLLLHPEPRKALFLGLGAGATFAAARSHPSLRARAVELSPEVVDALPAFEKPAADLAAAPDWLSLHVGDARRWVRADPDRYDVIVADTFHPARDGAALLYTVEHFEAVRARLAPGGLFAQWLPLHQFDLPMLRAVTRSFLHVFPDARLHMANASLSTPLLALIGGDAPAPTLSGLAARVSDGLLRADIAAVGLDSPFALLGGLIAGPQALADFAGEGPLNRDAFPHVLFGAPSTVYGALPPAGPRVLAVVEATRETRRAADAAALSPTARGADFARRIEAYWDARDAFMALGAQATLTGDPVADAQTLAPPLLAIVGISPDYAPAQRPLVALAQAMAAQEPAAAQELLRAVEMLAPAQAEAAAQARLALDRRTPSDGP